LLSNKIGSERLRKLQKVGDTRWNSKDAALQAIFHGFYEDHNKRDRFVILIEVLHTLGLILQLTVILDQKPGIF